MVRYKIFSLCGFFLLAAWGVHAQTPMKDVSQEDYRNMTEEAMRSRNYSQDRGQSWDARLKGVSGTVSVKAAGSEEWSQVTEETPLDSADSVKTGPDGTAELYLDDSGVFFIGRNTELEVSSVEQPDTTLSLKFGSLVAKVKHQLNDRFKMQVRTPSAVCAVRGTEFAVEYSRLGKDTGVAVFDEGRLAVTPLDEAGAPGTEQVLEKNTELSFTPTQKRFRAVPLARMIRHRGQLAGLRTTMQKRKKLWKRLSPSERAEMRDRALKRRVIRKQPGNAKARDAKKGRVLRSGAGRSKARAARQGNE